ncbi:hypothetical protein [Sulfurimonas sp.]|nr:hypothetical protein [Sulfurimonas sp.]MDD3452561.1 hypothetical protein [Sulfurimonas sp.]
MEQKNAKRIEIYDKNGNALQIAAHLKDAFVGKGYTAAEPKQKKENE